MPTTNQAGQTPVRRKRFIVILTLVAGALLLLGTATVTKVTTAGSDPTTTVPPGTITPVGVCQGVPGPVPTYFMSQAPSGSNFFGPMVEGTTAEVIAQHHNWRCMDPAQAVADEAYVSGDFSTLADGGVARMAQFLNDPALWADVVKGIEEHENTATSVDLVTVNGAYHTFYQTWDGYSPFIHQAQVERPDFVVLRFTYADGHTEDYNLSCGFQPVSLAQFPGVPTTPPSHPSCPPGSPECTPPTTPTTTPVCPPGQECGKDDGTSSAYNPGLKPGTPGCNPTDATPAGPSGTCPGNNGGTPDPAGSHDTPPPNGCTPSCIPAIPPPPTLSTTR